MVNWESILKEAGEQVQSISDGYKGKKSGIEHLGQGAGGDMTMKVDADAEKSIIELVKGQVDDVRFVSEEAGVVGKPGAAWTVVIDPIDGSMNYARGLPFYCTSIAVLDGPTLESAKHGLVRNLVLEETYYAERGRGAERDGTPIRTSKAKVLRESCVGIDMSKAPKQTVERLVPLIAAIRKPAHFGANALEQAFLADGKVDAFVDMRDRMRVVDFAAGYLIAKEAGAVMSNPTGGPVNTRVSLDEKFNVVASCNSTLHKSILRLLNP
ncbi:MAG TPA: inositol monophosphatase family protein [Nitrososphaerales archaeon]|nr:inositol monophosphatase family protein [Nitrososphaerales archaeon]HUK74358.1 inositol monophosphatase family protein [Nitrososphaerales archaeon]